MDSIVSVVIWDKDAFSQDDFMGEVEIDISELEVGTTYKNWYRLKQHCCVEPTAKQQWGYNDCVLCSSTVSFKMLSELKGIVFLVNI